MAISDQIKGVSSGEMEAALQVFVGSQARGLSASTVSRMKKEWEQEYEGWRERRVDQDEWVYIRADGLYSGLRDDENKLCALYAPL